MPKQYNPKQTVLFPDLFEYYDLPSITTLPEYDFAIQNFIKLADFGAFIELNTQGIDKSYSLSLGELQIPKRFLQTQQDAVSPTFHLFPVEIRNQLQRLKYEARTFFNRQNSIKTSFGYFLFRQYFHSWDRHKRATREKIIDFLQSEIGNRAYQEFFQNIWNQGAEWLKARLKRKYQRLVPVSNLANIRHKRSLLEGANTSLYQLDRDDPDFLYYCLLLKTEHIPIELSEYTAGIAILSTFKTIYLEHLKGTKIETIEDIHQLLKTLPNP